MGSQINDIRIAIDKLKPLVATEEKLISLVGELNVLESADRPGIMDLEEFKQENSEMKITNEIVNLWNRIENYKDEVFGIIMEIENAESADNPENDIWLEEEGEGVSMYGCLPATAALGSLITYAKIVLDVKLAEF